MYRYNLFSLQQHPLYSWPTASRFCLLYRDLSVKHVFRISFLALSLFIFASSWNSNAMPCNLTAGHLGSDVSAWLKNHCKMTRTFERNLLLLLLQALFLYVLILITQLASFKIHGERERNWLRSLIARWKPQERECEAKRQTRKIRSFKHIKISSVSPKKKSFASFFAQEIISTYVLYLINNEQVMLTSQFSPLVSSFDAWQRNERWMKSGKAKREKWELVAEN